MHLDRTEMTRRQALIVEDELDWREYFQEIICGIDDKEGSYDVRTAGDVGEAYQYLLKHKPSIAVVDVRLDESASDNYEGLRVLRLVREFSPETPVVVVTAHLGDEHVCRALDHYAVDGALAKQEFDKSEFIRIIQERVWTTSGRPERPDILPSVACSARKPEPPLGYLEATLDRQKTNEPYKLSVRVVLREYTQAHQRFPLDERPCFVVTVHSPNARIDPDWCQILRVSTETLSSQVDFTLIPREKDMAPIGNIRLCLYHKNHLIQALSL